MPCYLLSYLYLMPVDAEGLVRTSRFHPIRANTARRSVPEMCAVHSCLTEGDLIRVRRGLGSLQFKSQQVICRPEWKNLLIRILCYAYENTKTRSWFILGESLVILRGQTLPRLLKCFWECFPHKLSCAPFLKVILAGYYRAKKIGGNFKRHEKCCQYNLARSSTLRRPCGVCQCCKGFYMTKRGEWKSSVVTTVSYISPDEYPHPTLPQIHIGKAEPVRPKLRNLEKQIDKLGFVKMKKTVLFKKDW